MDWHRYPMLETFLKTHWSAEKCLGIQWYEPCVVRYANGKILISYLILTKDEIVVADYPRPRRLRPLLLMADIQHYQDVQKGTELATLLRGTSRSSSLPIWIYYRPVIKKGKTSAVFERWRRIFSRRRKKDCCTEQRAESTHPDDPRGTDDVRVNNQIQLFTFSENSPLLHLIRILYDRRLMMAFRSEEGKVATRQETPVFSRAKRSRMYYHHRRHLLSCRELENDWPASIARLQCFSLLLGHLEIKIRFWKDTEFIFHLLCLSGQLYRRPEANDKVVLMRWLILLWTECLRDLPFLIMHTHNGYSDRVCQMLDNMALYSMQATHAAYTCRERIDFLYEYVTLRQWRKLADHAEAKYAATFHRQMLHRFLAECVLPSADRLPLSLMIVLRYHWQPPLHDQELPHWTCSSYTLCLKRLAATAVELENDTRAPSYNMRFKTLLLELMLLDRPF